MNILDSLIFNSVDYSLVNNDDKITHGHGKGSGIPGPIAGQHSSSSKVTVDGVPHTKQDDGRWKNDANGSIVSPGIMDAWSKSRNVKPVETSKDKGHEGLTSLRDKIADKSGLSKNHDNIIMDDSAPHGGGSGSGGNKIRLDSFNKRKYEEASKLHPKDWDDDHTTAVKTAAHEVSHTLGNKESGFQLDEQHFATTTKDVPSSNDSRKLVKMGTGMFLEEAPVEILARHHTGEERGKEWNFKKDSGSYQQYVIGLESLASHVGKTPIQLARDMKSKSQRDRQVLVGRLLGAKDDKDALSRGQRYTTEVLSQGNDFPPKKKDFKDTIKEISKGDKPVLNQQLDSLIFNTVDLSLLFNEEKVTHGHGKGSGIPGPLPGIHHESGKIEEDSKDKPTKDPRIKSIIGKDITEKELVESLCPIDGGKHTVEYTRIGYDNKPGIKVTVEHPMFHTPCIRIISRDDKGELFVKNESVDIGKEHQGKGVGSSLFSNQVEKCKSLGVSYFTSHLAEGQRAEIYPGVRAEGSSFTGYYVWPSLGYDQKISDITPRQMGDKEYQAKELLKSIKKEFPHAKTIQDIYHTEGGRDWWKYNGIDLTNARFDLKDGSKSLEILNKYMESRRKVGK